MDIIHEETEDKCERRRRRIDDVGKEYDGEANNLLNSCIILKGLSRVSNSAYISIFGIKYLRDPPP